MHTEEDKNYASSGVGNTALGLSIAALSGWGLSGGLNNLLGGGNNRPTPPAPATQRDLDYERKLTELNAENGQLKAQIYTDQQVLASERRCMDKIDALRDKVTAMDQAQAVLNAHQSDAIMLAQGEINRMKSVFQLYIGGPTMAASEAVFQAYKPTAAATTTAATTGAAA